MPFSYKMIAVRNEESQRYYMYIENISYIATNMVIIENFLSKDLYFKYVNFVPVYI